MLSSTPEVWHSEHHMALWVSLSLGAKGSYGNSQLTLMRGDNVKEQMTLLTTPILGPTSHDMDN